MRKYVYRFSKYGEMRDRLKARKKRKSVYNSQLLVGLYKYIRKAGEIMPEVRKVKEHYEIYVDGSFVCSCDIGELSTTLEELRT